MLTLEFQRMASSKVTGDVEDDLPLPVMQFSSLTTALLGVEGSQSDSIFNSHDPEAIGYPTDDNLVAGCRPSRIHEQEAQLVPLADIGSQPMNEYPSGGTNRRLYAQSVPREDKGGTIALQEACLRKSMEYENCTRSFEETCGGSIANCTSCKSK